MPRAKKDMVTSIRLPVELHERLKRAARVDDRSLTKYIIRALKDKLDKDGK